MTNPSSVTKNLKQKLPICRLIARIAGATCASYRCEASCRCTPDLPTSRHALGLYSHHKSGEYEAMDVARHSEMLEALAVVDGVRRPLFEKLDRAQRSSGLRIASPFFVQIASETDRPITLNEPPTKQLKS